MKFKEGMGRMEQDGGGRGAKVGNRWWREGGRKDIREKEIKIKSKEGQK